MAGRSSPLVSRIDRRRNTASGWTNWGRTQTCHPKTFAQPRTEAELQALVRRAAAAEATVKAVGSGHSFTGIACTNSVMVSLDHLSNVHNIKHGGEGSSSTITVGAGLKLEVLNRVLAEAGLAMTNLGDIAYQTVAGAVSTGTHGTGLRFGGLATQLRALRLVTGTGDVIDCDPSTNSDVFAAARVGLGALGIITRATIAVEPAFNLHAVEEPLPIDDVLDGWLEHVEANDHFEFFWIPGTRRASTKTNRRTFDSINPMPRSRYVQDKIFGENLGFGALCAIGSRRPSLVPRLAKLMASAPSRVEYTDHSHKVFASPRWVKFAEMEYSVPLADLPVVVRRIAEEVKRHKIDLLFPVEARSAAADDVPLSTAYGRPSAYIAVHRYRGRPYQQYFELVENICNEHEGRPHWGKIHFQTAQTLVDRYPRWQDFHSVRARMDPAGRFANSYLDRVLGPLPSGPLNSTRAPT